MKKLIIAALLFSDAWLYAGGTSVLVLADYHSMQSPVSISVPAQYLAAEIRISCAEDDWDLKLAGIDNARRSLADAAKTDGFKLRIEQALVFEANYRKFSFSSSSGGASEALSDVLILAPVDERSDLVEIVRKFRTIISSLRLPKKVSVSIGTVHLALENPENWRADLVKKIREQVETTATALSESCDYDIGGLEEPVRVRQKDERGLEVFLPYSVTYHTHKKGQPDT